MIQMLSTVETTLTQKTKNKMNTTKKTFAPQYEQNGVEFGYNPKFRKWSFQAGTVSFLTPVKGGVNTARKVATQVQHAAKRTNGKGMDNFARMNIGNILSAADRAMTAEME